jgi:hypothetical protein
MLHVSVLLTDQAYKYISKTQVYLQVEYITLPDGGPWEALKHVALLMQTIKLVMFDDSVFSNVEMSQQNGINSITRVAICSVCTIIQWLNNILSL